MYTKEDRRYAYELYQSGYTVPEIVSETGISRATVYRILENYDFDGGEFNEKSQNLDVSDDSDFDYSDSIEDNWQYNDMVSPDSRSQNFENEIEPEIVESGISHETDNDMKQQNIEVEKLRLKLEHEREMEKLRQLRKAQELEERRIEKESELLAKKEKERQKRILEEEEEEERINKQLLLKIKRIIRDLDVEREDKPFTRTDLQNKLQEFMDIQNEVEDRAIELDQDHEDWLVWQCLDMTFSVLNEALARIDDSLFSNSTNLQMEEEEINLIERLLKALFLNLFYEQDED